MTDSNGREVDGWVYFFRSTVTKQTKIGCSGRPQNRFCDLSNNVPGLEEVGYVASSHTRWLEKWLHVAFADKREQGEWFALSDSDLDAIRTIPEYVGGETDIPALLRVMHTANWIREERDDNDDTIRTWSPCRVELLIALAAAMSGQDDFAYATAHIVPFLESECRRLLPGAAPDLQTYVRELIGETPVA